MTPSKPRFVTLCGRIFRDADKTWFPHTTHRGRTLYFCTQVCLDAFLADPEAFYRSHRNSENKKGCIRPNELRNLE